MTIINQRTYGCKDEELPVICNYVVFSLKRDIADFMVFSPKFNDAFITSFETKIASVSEVIISKTETLNLKNLTIRLYATMDGLIDPINRIGGYLKLAQPGINISSADFGLTLLRKGINSKNAEGVVKSLHIVVANLIKYASILSEQGLTAELSNRFSTAAISIVADNQQQYEITSNRKNIVQNNVNLFNGLNEQLLYILRVGKILYKATDAVKTQEYSFTALKKKVNNTAKKAAVTPTDAKATPATPGSPI